jgi:hypothetical protein
LDFLGVDPKFSPTFDIVNPNKQLRWPVIKKYMLDSPYFRKTLRLLFSHEIYAWLKNFYKSKIVTYKPRQSINDELKTELMKEFKQEVEKISDLIHRDLFTLWGYKNV